ncbi:MAG: hypothetical protein AB8V23_04980 [Candidatus Midichloria sp.]|uniref:Uncharacterized protein n=1 Tax=Hyalomma marginatum TaxID=34627 RepID=A0A8S4C2Z2_9ACAR|nr:hypothetical protein MHYMCMPSP_01038 [Hyalomma marginatum]CAG7598487.1 hypothetical protein MHYMCMPASI_01020 [Hyalomma marginatum]
MGFLREIAFDPSKESTLKVFTSVSVAESIEEVLRSSDHYIDLFANTTQLELAELQYTLFTRSTLGTPAP